MTRILQSGSGHEAATPPVFVNVAPGEHYVTTRPDVVITTVLGSCVAACIRDPMAAVGGINHFMLPSSEIGAWGEASGSLRYGNFAMERLINEIIKRGGQRNRLEVKVFGGGNVLSTGAPVGHLNADFVEWYLRSEGMAIAAAQLRGKTARKIRYAPATGRALVMELSMASARAPVAQESHYRNTLTRSPVENDVELFG
jgi:chemotaxis protein CheD